MKYLKYIWTILLLVWIFLIFYFSSQNGSESGGLSDKIVNMFIKIFIPNFDNLEVAKQESIVDIISFITRKLAHFTEYFILSFFAFMNIMYIIKKKTIYTLIFCFIIACSDELFQHFIPGRNGNFIDVCIDFTGSFIFFLIGYFIYRRKLKNGN